MDERSPQCPDCRFCQRCSETRCRVCRGEGREAGPCELGKGFTLGVYEIWKKEKMA